MAPTSMTAARFHEVNEPLRLEEVPVPEIREDEVLVQVKPSGCAVRTYTSSSRA